MVKREIENLRVLDHPQIIKLHDIFEDSLYLHIVMDYCKGGDLMEFIIDKGPMDELKAAIIMKKILSALHYIHAMNIAHRDLKPENILLYDNSVNSDIVIIDFGISAKFDD